MKLLQLTLPTAEENVALDDALVQTADAGAAGDEILRIWEPPRPLVVIGRSSAVEAEVQLDACRADGVPVLRRCSGGAAIVAAPGCLMYALVLSYQRRPDLRLIDRAHQFVLARIAAALDQHVPGVRHVGTSDLAVGDRKVSGNSMRCCRRHLLYHGTLLCRMRLELIERYLRMPPRQPEYRAGRKHGAFVSNLDMDPASFGPSIAAAWQAWEATDSWPRERTEQLVHERYTRATWNYAR